MTKSISIITPFLNGIDLLPDYIAATLGAELILIDNGSDQETADALRELPPDRGVLIRNERNLGFAAANNQGYAAATGDIIIFLNSDIAGDPAWLGLVADDVQDGALYGPSVARQLVYGMWLPYVEGWCVAATRKTWERLFKDDLSLGIDYVVECGPWDALAYPGPYWEDNDLSLRAIHVLALVDAVACEDTRHSRTLLQHYAIDAPLRPYHDHNADEMRPRVLADIAAAELVVDLRSGSYAALGRVPGAVHVEVLADHAPRLRLDTIVCDPTFLAGDTHLAGYAASLGAQLIVAPVRRPDGSPRHDVHRLAAVYADLMK